MRKRTQQSIGESVRWLTLQIEGVAYYAAKPDSHLSVEEMGVVLSSLKRAEMLVSRKFADLLDAIDDGRAA